MVPNNGSELSWCLDWGGVLEWNGRVWQSPMRRWRTDAVTRTVRAETLDALPELLATPGGVVQLFRGEVLDPEPAMFLTAETAVPVGLGENCPRFLVWLAEAVTGDTEAVRVFCRGALLRAVNGPRLLFGENLLLLHEVLSAVLGGIYCALSPKVWVEFPCQNGIFAARLMGGARLALLQPRERWPRFPADAVAHMLAFNGRAQFHGTEDRPFWQGIPTHFFYSGAPPREARNPFLDAYALRLRPPVATRLFPRHLPPFSWLSAEAPSILGWVLGAGE
jgi:hypothetical protein